MEKEMTIICGKDKQDSWRRRFFPSIEMTASFAIPNECEESRFMLRIS